MENSLLLTAFRAPKFISSSQGEEGARVILKGAGMLGWFKLVNMIYKIVMVSTMKNIAMPFWSKLERIMQS